MSIITKIIMRLMEGWSQRKKISMVPSSRESNMLATIGIPISSLFSAVCDPAGETGRCRKQKYREYLKNRLQHGVIINEGIKINVELILLVECRMPWA
jgi:hypothetical protein